jgi:branched-subunit amino acid transport protein
MSLWFWVLAACALSYALKLVGYLVPGHVLDDPRVARMAGTVTVGLLAALVVMNAFGSGRELALDARLGALLVAGAALVLRAPFLVVVVLGAAAAAVLRLLGAP